MNDNDNNHPKEDRVMVVAEIGVTPLEAKECQRWPKPKRSLYETKEDSFRCGSEGPRHCRRLDFELEPPER